MTRPWIAGLSVLTLLVSACASSPDQTTTTSTRAATSTSTTTTVSVPATTSTVAATTTTADVPDEADVSIRVAISDGQVSVEPAEPEASLGNVVELTIVSDTDETVHVHGYDLIVTVGPNEPASLRFTAEVPGIFEVELEHSGTHIFELTVR